MVLFRRFSLPWWTSSLTTRLDKSVTAFSARASTSTKYTANYDRWVKRTRLPPRWSCPALPSPCFRRQPASPEFPDSPTSSITTTRAQPNAQTNGIPVYLVPGNVTNAASKGMRTGVDGTGQNVRIFRELEFHGKTMHARRVAHSRCLMGLSDAPSQYASAKDDKKCPKLCQKVSPSGPISNLPNLFVQVCSRAAIRSCWS